MAKASMFNDWFKINYFTLFSLPICYQVDRDELMARYREVLKKIHPDQLVHLPIEEQRLATQVTSFVNDALATLQSPLKRACYLLSIHGFALELENKTIQDNEFLTQQMEWRENIAASRHDAHAIKNLFLRLEKNQADLFLKLEEACTDQDWLLAQRLVLQLTFFEKLIKEVKSYVST